MSHSFVWPVYEKILVRGALCVGEAEVEPARVMSIENDPEGVDEDGRGAGPKDDVLTLVKGTKGPGDRTEAGDGAEARSGTGA